MGFDLIMLGILNLKLVSRFITKTIYAKDAGNMHSNAHQKMVLKVQVLAGGSALYC